MNFVEDDDSKGKEYHHETETVCEHPPFVATDAKHSVLEEFDDSGNGVALHDKANLGVGDSRKRVDNRRGVHPETDEEREKHLEIAVLG